MIDVGPFCIMGDWDKSPEPAGKLVIRMCPCCGVFGAGWRRETQMALLALADEVKPGDFVVDIGTGTGILSVAAKRLGAGRVVATEIHPDALKMAAEVFRLNKVDVELVEGTYIDEEADLAIHTIGDVGMLEVPDDPYNAGPWWKVTGRSAKDQEVVSRIKAKRKLILGLDRSVDVRQRAAGRAPLVMEKLT